MNDINKLKLPLSNHNEISPLENYLEYRLLLEMIFVTPMIMYGIFLTYLIHISRNSKFNLRKLNKKTLKIKRILTTIMSVYFIYQFIALAYLGYDLASGDLFLLLFLQFLEIFISLLTFFVNYELSKKLTRKQYPKLFLLFWIVISFKIFIEILLEFHYDLVLKLLTFSSLGLICSLALSYLHYRYPRNNLHSKGHEIYYELQYLPLLSSGAINLSEEKVNTSDKFKNWRINKFKLNKVHTVPQEESQKRLDKSFNSEKSKSASLTLTEKYFFDKSLNERISIDHISRNQPEMLPNYPKIKIIFKDNYKYYQSKSIFSDENFKDNISKFEFINNFYFHLVIKLREKNINHSVKRSIQDFLELEQDLKTEFYNGKYSKKLRDKLPRLKIPKICKFADFFNKYKVSFERFIKSIVNEPNYITDEVLNFLEINDEQLSFSYNLIRKKNLYTNRITDDTFILKNSSIDICMFIDQSREDNGHLNRMKIENKLSPYARKFLSSKNIIQGNNLNTYNISPPIQLQKLAIDAIKITILDIKQDIHSGSSEFTVIIRISHNFMFRIIYKKISDVLKMITELSNINKSNQNVKTLLKTLQTGDFSETLLNIHNIRSTYSLLENVLQNTYDNFSSYKTNVIISEFYHEIFDESRTNSGCDSLVNFGKNLIISKQKEIKKKKKKIEFYRILVNDHQILSVKAEVINFIFLMIDFKPHVFYVVNFKSKLVNGNIEEITKKLKYHELNEFINLMSIRLNLIGKIIEGKKLFHRNLDEKIQIRKNELQSNLTTIFDSINLIKDKEWIQILERDKKYRLMKAEKNKQNKLKSKPSFILQHRTESRESIFNINIRDSIL